MAMNISENIRRLRLQCGLTQEQLAEALGVTVGAVYKWEAGRSVPELGCIIELAELFQVSVDALLGYELRNNDREHTAERLKDYLHDYADPQALEDAEKALRRYPNDFKIVYNCARVYYIQGWEKRDDDLLRRALELFQRSCPLIGQNTDEDISLLSIQTTIAEIYFSLKQHDKAVELLKANNPCRVQSALIGSILADKGDREALRYLSEALLDLLMTQSQIAMGYLNIYEQSGEYGEALAVTDWTLDFLRALSRPGRSSFLQKEKAALLALRGYVYLRMGEKAEAAGSLRQARDTALAFDSSPSRDGGDIRFVSLERRSTIHDSLGQTGLESIESAIEQQNCPELRALWEEVKNERKQ